MLEAEGLTGAPDYAVGRVRKLTPYHYSVAAQFSGARGTGTRTETRPCTLDFMKS